MTKETVYELVEIKKILQKNYDLNKKLFDFFIASEKKSKSGFFSTSNRVIASTAEATAESIKKNLDKHSKDKNIDKFNEYVTNIKNKVKEVRDYIEASSRRVKVYEEKILRFYDIISRNFSYNNDFYGIMGSVLEKLPLLGAILSPVPGILREYTDALRKVTISTVDYEDGLNGVAISSQKLGMSLREYADFVSKYAGAINRYGLPSILRMAQNIRFNNDYIYRMGLTTEEVTNYFGEFLEQQRIADGRRNRTENELQEMFSRQMKMVFEIARRTGRSFEEVFQSLKEQIIKPDIALLFRDIPEKVRNEILKFTESVPALRNVFEDYLRKGTIYFSAEVDSMLITYASDIEKVFRGIKNGAMSHEEAIKYLLKVTENLSEDQLKRLFLIDENTAEFASKLKVQLEKINSSIEKNFDETKLDNVSKFLMSLDMRFREILGTIKESFIRGLVGTKTTDELDKMFENLRKGLENLAKFFGSMLSSALTEENITKLRMGITDFFEVAKIFFKNIKTFFEYINSFLEWILKKDPISLLSAAGWGIVGIQFGKMILRKAFSTVGTVLISGLKNLFSIIVYSIIPPLTNSIKSLIGTTISYLGAYSADFLKKVIERMDKAKSSSIGRSARNTAGKILGKLRNIRGGGLFGLGLGLLGFLGGSVLGDEIEGEEDILQGSKLKETEESKSEERKSVGESLKRLFSGTLESAVTGAGVGAATTAITGVGVVPGMAAGAAWGVASNLIENREELKNIGEGIGEIISESFQNLSEKMDQQISLVKEQLKIVRDQLGLMQDDYNVKARERASAPLQDIDIGTLMISP